MSDYRCPLCDRRTISGNICSDCRDRFEEPYPDEYEYDKEIEFKAVNRLEVE